ncbi:2-oxoglutarate dehydrogenase E1 component [Deltaproteobacteria bacterium TL4]
MDIYSYLGNADIGVVNQLYEQYKKNPESVEPEWQIFFSGFDFSKEKYSKPDESPLVFQKEMNVLNLIGAYRQRGHLFAKTNPVRSRRKLEEPLDLKNYDLSEGDLDTMFHAGTCIDCKPRTLREIVGDMEQTYCQAIGIEYKFMRAPGTVEWLRKRMEDCYNTPKFSVEQKKRLLKKVTEAVVFEDFLHTKFVGQKRFSLEGGETIIPALDTLVEKGAQLGIAEFVIGMAHRGRLNTLTNVLGKDYGDIFTEFQGKKIDEASFEGDVKYHLGYSSDRVTDSGKIVHFSLTPNPSHLEAVNPVVEGIVRSKIDLRYGGDYSKICPILIHGDAAMAGQGINYEVLQMSLLEAYKTGGTVHVILNNQIGFTTNYLDGRSSTYCTDLAKTTLSPVFHINGDDVEAVAYVIQLALDFRNEFHRDVFIDIVGYRKRGHNESDEPRFTQPALYKIIENHPNPKDIYSNKLIEEGSIPLEFPKQYEMEFKSILEKRLEESKNRSTVTITSFLEGQWTGMRLATEKDFHKSPKTGVDQKLLVKVADKLTEVPADVIFFSKNKKLFEDRSEMIHTTNKIDWAMAELLAFGTLVEEGTPIRFSGQDVKRGTFSQRHAVITLPETDVEYFPLQNISANQASCNIYNSLLSEFGVLGFEYGYAMASPRVLSLWEAQFGDFVNGAQIIVDQFLCCSETKWQRMVGLVLLLPHGLEGQGPEHSSGRPERFLQLCADNNMQIANCTTPANYFHLLRRQVARPFRKPLIVFTPKSLLRHPECTSPLEDFVKGTCFYEIYDDSYVDPRSVKRILICTGKIYFDLLKRQQEEKRTDVAIVRLEQLYPFPKVQLQKIVTRYKSVKQWFWVQEEPENQGVWSFMLRKSHLKALECIARKESSTPGTGFPSIYRKEQQELVDKAFQG